MCLIDNFFVFCRNMVSQLQEAEDEAVLIPIEKPSHCYSVPVTWKELERIFAVYPDGA